MSVAPPPALLQRLARRRLGVPRARPAGGVGEHRSRALGPAMEFAEYRQYQPGDDLRRVDPHLEARSGELYLREGDMLERLAVTIALDMSASMAYGEPAKAMLAKRLSAAIAYVGLAGADSVRMAAFDGRGLRWSQRASSVRGAGRLFEWLERQQPHGAADLTLVGRALAADVPRPGLLVVVSDWLFADPAAGLATLRAARQEVVGVQVCAPAELDPSALGGGAVALQDAETGAELDVVLTPQALQAYAARLQRWQEELRRLFVRYGSTWLTASSDADPERLLLGEWAARGLIR